MNDDQVLKNYGSYIKRLNKFSAALGITVIHHHEVEGDGVWMPARSRIKIDKNLSQMEEISTYLHELGHALDDLHGGIKSSTRLHKAYHAVYSEKARKSQTQLVIECEARAWAIGREIAKKLKIRLGKWYDYAESVSIKAYKEK